MENFQQKKIYICWLDEVLFIFGLVKAKYTYSVRRSAAFVTLRERGNFLKICPLLHNK